jgi:hypothetical protein
MRKVRRGVTRVTGIFYHPKGRFAVEMSKTNGSEHLGIYDTLMEALRARAKGELAYHGEVTWITQTQIIDLERFLNIVYSWEYNRENYRCTQCKQPIQILSVEDIAKMKNPEKVKALPELEYMAIHLHRESNVSGIRKSDKDVMICSCGWISIHLHEIFHYGADSAHIQEKFLKIPNRPSDDIPFDRYFEPPKHPATPPHVYIPSDEMPDYQPPPPIGIESFTAEEEQRFEDMCLNLSPIGDNDNFFD